MEKMRKDVLRDLSFMSYAPVLFISALTGQRTERLFELINLSTTRALCASPPACSTTSRRRAGARPAADGQKAPPEDLLYDADGRQAALLRCVLQQ